MGTSVSRAMLAHIRTILVALAALALTLILAPSALFADDSVGAGLAPATIEGSAEGAIPDSDFPNAEAPSMPASMLTGSTSAILSADIPFDAAEPLIGSFTVDGLTYSVNPDGLTLVSVNPDGLTLVSVDPAAVLDGVISIPASATYNGAAYDVTAIAPYAFYLSGAMQVELPATIVSVDDRAFRSSDVERVEVAADNPDYASFDGALYSADESCLLLIPEGRAGAVLLPEIAEVVQASKFSHCSLVDAISVGEDGAAYASWDGLLYSADGTTLLRVPAGATEITIRDGCTTIAAGSLEGCASLERIHAPASVTSISPDVFTSIPTVSLPVAVVAQDESMSADNVASGLPDQSNASADSIPQLTAMVALSTTEDDLPEVNPSSIKVALPENADETPWFAAGLSPIKVAGEMPVASSQEAASYQGYRTQLNGNGGTVHCDNTSADYPEGGGAGVISAPVVSDWITAQDGKWKIGKLGQVVYDNGDPLFYWWAYAEDAQGRRALGWSDTPSGKPLAVGTVVTNYAVLYAVWSPAITILDGNGGIVHANTTSPVSSTDARWQGWAIQDGPIIENWIYKTDGFWQIRGNEVSYDNGDPSEYWWAYAEDARGNRAIGWSDTPNGKPLPQGTVITDYPRLYAVWSFDVSFDTSSEPGDEDYPGEAKPDKTINTGDGQVAIEDPKRPGYVFEGWIIPSDDGAEAVDQELVYQGGDGKWYVDASKLPDYAGDDGRVELTARWTSVISVDVPQSVTFYADAVTQGQESREGAASGGGAEGAFGQNKAVNQSEVDLRVVGLESSAVKTTGTTLGADSVLKKADAATPSTSAGKLLSLYPSAKQWTAEELQDPNATGGTKAADAVDFDLDDILLEASFPSDSFTIPAGDTLNMGYRLNLTETGQQLDYDKLATLEDGQSAAIANVSYCFATNGYYPTGTGTTNDDIYIVDGDTVYGPSEIKQSAASIARSGSEAPAYPLFKRFLDSGMDPGEPSDPKGYVRWGDGKTYSIRIIGINEDYVDEARTTYAGLTFQFIDILPTVSRYNSANTNQGGWEASELRARMNPGSQTVASGTDDDGIWLQVRPGLAEVIQPVCKWTHNDYGTTNAEPTPTMDHLWLISNSELVMPGTQLSSWAGYPWVAHEGTAAPYSYWRAQDVSGSEEKQPSLFQYRNGGRYWSYLRSPTPGSAYYCLIINSSGGAFANNTTNGILDRAGGVRPCFCL